MAHIYSNVLVAIDLKPGLEQPELQAIADASDACIKRYGQDFEHWPLVMLAAALSAPVAVRLKPMLQRRKEKKAGQPKPPQPKNESENVVGDIRPTKKG